MNPEDANVFAYNIIDKYKYRPSNMKTFEFLGLTMRNFQGIVFIWTEAYTEMYL